MILKAIFTLFTKAAESLAQAVKAAQALSILSAPLLVKNT